MRRAVSALLATTAASLLAAAPLAAQPVHPAPAQGQAAAAAQPQSRTSAQLNVTRAWARATAPNAQTGAAYFTVYNSGPADTLTGASTPIADTAEVHRTTATQNGVMQMRPVKTVTVSQGKMTTFAPGGLHVMLMGLKQPLSPGDTFPLTLTFQKAGDVTVTATVQNAGALSPTLSGVAH